MAKRWFVALLAGAAALSAAQDMSKFTQGMGIEQKLGDKIPLETPFKDEAGKDVKIGDYIGERPVVLIPIFYNCATGCALITDNFMKKLVKANQSDHLIVGRDFDVLMISIHPKETPELAAGRKSEMIRDLGRPEAADDWHLLTGSYENILAVTNSIGFKYRYDAEKNLINHPTCAAIISPTGVISAYTIGSDTPTAMLKAGVELAAKNQVSKAADQSFMFGCIMLDPNTGKYTLVVKNVMKVAGFLTIFIVAFAIIRMSLKYRRAPLPTSGGGLG